jgi:hypothetical protein
MLSLRLRVRLRRSSATLSRPLIPGLTDSLGEELRSRLRLLLPRLGCESFNFDRFGDTERDRLVDIVETEEDE